MDPLTIINLIEAGFSLIEGVITELKNSGVIPGTSPVHPAVAQMKQALTTAKAQAAQPAAP
jgi:hypothetical protein